MLRQQEHVSSGCIDDAYLQSTTYEDSARNVIDTVVLYSTQELVTHPGNSVSKATQILEFWGFLLNFACMRITLTSQKVEKIVKACFSLLNKAVVFLFVKYLG